MKRRNATPITFIITLTDAGDPLPPEMRLKRLLKLAGRSLSLRCRDVKYAAAPDAPAATKNDDPTMTSPPDQSRRNGVTIAASSGRAGAR